MDFVKKCLAGFLVLQAFHFTPAWAANNESEKPPGPPPTDGNFHMVRPLDFHSFSLDEAKKLIHDFSGTIDKSAKTAVLSGNIPNECAAHIAIKADPDGDENALYSFSILDKDGQAISCLEKHKDEKCSTATPCVSLKELSLNEKSKKDFIIAIPVDNKDLDKARVGLHSSDAVDVNGKTEASAECNCSAKPPGDQKELEKLAADMDDIDSEKVRKKSRRTPKKEIAREDEDINNNDDDSSSSSKTRSGIPFQGMNNQMVAGGTMNMQMNQAMMMSYYQQMMMASMYQSSMRGMNSGMGMGASMYGNGMYGSGLGSMYGMGMTGMGMGNMYGMNGLNSMMYNQGYPYMNTGNLTGGLNLNLTAGIR